MTAIRPNVATPSLKSCAASVRAVTSGSNIALARIARARTRRPTVRSTPGATRRNNLAQV
jgi:hypothetical protein